MEIRLPIVCLLFQLLGFQISGQTLKVDSLKKALAGAKNIERVKVLNQLSELLRHVKPSEAVSCAEKAETLSEEIGYSQGVIASYENIGMTYREDYPKKIEFLSKALTVAEQIEDLEAVVRIEINIAQTYALPNNYEKSLEFYLKALTVNQKLKSAKFEARALNGVAWVYKNSGKFKEAIESFSKALTLFEELKDEKTIPWAYVGMASTYTDSNDYSNALSYLEKAYSRFQSQNDQAAMAICLYKTGEVFLKKKSWNDAITYLNRSLELSELIKQQTAIAISLKLLGEAYQNKNENDKAIDCFLKSQSIARKLKMREHLSQTYHSLSHLYEKRGDFKNAYTYQELHIAYYDSVFNQEKNKQLAEMQTRYETENKEKEIDILKKDKFIDRIYLISVSAGLILALLIAFLIINRQRLKTAAERELTKREMQIFEEQRSLTEAELQIKTLREKQLEGELEFKNKELTTFTLNLIQKNEILETLKTQIAAIRNSSDETTNAKLNGLMSTVNFSFRLDRDWENFKLHFQQVHKDFFERLNRAYPDLSNNDLKVCALLKLNLGTKEMAAILDISAESVKAARYRIRKKINAPSEQSLSSFFINFPAN